jgi:hypothetical protein
VVDGLYALTLGIARAFAPLHHQLRGPGIEVLFGQLGVSPPTSFWQLTAVRDALEQAAVAAADLPDDILGVRQASGELPGTDEDGEPAAGGPAEIALAFARLLATLDDVVTTIGDLGTVLKARAGEAGAASAALDELADDLDRRLPEHLLITSLELAHPVPTRLAALFGLLEFTHVTADPSVGRPEHLRRTLRADRLPQLLSDPVEVLGEVWGWSGNAFDGEAFLGQLRLLLATAGFPVGREPDGELTLGVAGIRATGGADPTLTVTLLGSLAADWNGEVALGTDGWVAELTTTGDLAFGPTIDITPPLQLGAPEAVGSVGGRAEIGLRRGRPPEAGENDDLVLFGSRDGTRLTADTVRLVGTIDFDTDLGGGGVDGSLGFAADLDGGKLTIVLSGADGFLARFLPDETTLAFDVGMRWSDAHGLVLRGASELAIEVPLGLTIGPLRLEALGLALVAADGAIALRATLTGGFDLGPITVVVTGVGARITTTIGGDGAELVNVGVDLEPPRGLGLAVDAGPVTGGGFIDHDPDAGRYEGALQLKIAHIGISALGLLETRMPDGGDGYSLLVVIRAEFPPIALPFGFVLTSVGGLLGLNRRIDVDALRDRFASGAVGRILAPEDPAGNAPALLAELGEVFPATEGIFVVGPTLQLGWTAIVRFDVGVFLELPGPSKVVLLGSVRASIDAPDGRALLQLRLDVMGVLDLPKQTLEFDAVLVDSQLLEVFELTGGAAFRLNWGPKPHVVMSVGGFHPQFDPAPLTFPSSLTRIAMTRGRRQDPFYLRFEGYFAITGNSLQLGASAEMVLRAAGFVAEGSFAFDVLIRFQPFSFELDVRASLRVAYKGRTLAGVKVVGSLSGPGPIEFSGKVSFEILFLTISWRGSFQFGTSSPATVTPIESVAAELLPELREPRNLVAADGGDREVVLELDTHDAATPLVPPLGRLIWQQTRAPLNLLLERFEGAPVPEPATLWVTHDLAGPADDQIEWFAPGMFVALSDAEKLDRPGFEEFDAGVSLAADAPIRPEPRQVGFGFDERILPEAAASADPWSVELPAWVLDAADGRIPAHQVPAPAVSMTRVRHEVRSTETGDPITSGGMSEAQAHQLIRYGAPAAVAVVGDVVAVPDL